MNWIERIASIPGTIVSAAAETIHLIPLEGCLPNLALATTFQHPWIDAWRTVGIRTFCLEEHDAEPPATTADLLTHPSTLNWLSTLPQPIHILVFKPEDRVEQLLNKAGFHLLNPPAGLSRRLENKLNFPSLAAESGQDTIPYSFFTLTEKLQWAEISDLIGPKIIIQFAKGFSGNRTYLVTSNEEFCAVRNRFPGRRCRLCAFREGKTWTANGCVMSEFQVVTRPPFLQITRFSESKDGMPRTIGSRGNLWAPPPKDIAQQITIAMEATGRMLGRYGFRGIFGADFLQIDREDRAIMVEINPRLVASIPILTPLEMIHGMPLLAAHLLSFCADAFCEIDSPILPDRGGQLIFRGTDEGADGLSRDIGIGLYDFSDRNGFSRVSDDWSPSHVRGARCLIWKPPTEKTMYSERLRLVFDLDEGTMGGDPVVYFQRHL